MGLPTKQPEAYGMPQVFVLLSDPVLQSEYQSALKSSRYCLVWHNQTDDWISALEKFQYDVGILDLSTFGPRAIECLNQAKSVAPATDWIVLAPDDHAQTAIDAFRAGITDYFLRPASPESLAWSIGRIIARRAVTIADETMERDLRVFSAAHHIHTAETEAQMRELAVRTIADYIDADSGCAVQLSGPPPSLLQVSGVPASAKESLGALLGQFRNDHPLHLEQTFDMGITALPEKWKIGNYVWIPLKSIFLGGLFFHGIKTNPAPDSFARIEFLVRNLEIALENIARHKEVKQLTYVDDLTGLYNSRYLKVALGAAVASYKQRKKAFSVLFVDIDRFKEVNDNNGHLVGSRLLMDLSEVLKQQVRKTDLLFRYGGDEFVILLLDTPTERALEVGERIRQTVEEKRFFAVGREYAVTLSIGVASYPEHGKDRDSLLKMADDAMYCSKKSGRNSVFVASATTPPKKSAS